MAIKVFEFILRAVHAINLCVSLATSTGIDPGYKLYRDVEFTSQQMNFSIKVCSTENPDQVFKRARSSIECALMCRGTGGCSGVNWKQPSTCELYVPIQRSFGTDASCTYFGLGPAILVLRNDWVRSRSKFFKRSWAEYEQAFGSKTTQYWIGLSKLYSMSRNYCNIYFNVQAVNGSWFYAEYSRFSVGEPSTRYKLSIDGYYGNAGDAMKSHNGRPFSTYDRVAPDLGSTFLDCGGGFWFSYNQFAMITTGSAQCNFGWFPPEASSGFVMNAVEVYIRCQA